MIRTLFPRLTTPSTESPCSSPTLGSVGPSRMLTSANNHMTTSPKADSTVATVSLFESPLKEQAEQEEACSQELFDSPEIFTPNLPAPANQSPIELDQCMEQSVWNKRVTSSEMLLMTPAALSQPPVHSTPLHPHTPGRVSFVFLYALFIIILQLVPPCPLPLWPLQQSCVRQPLL